MDRSEILRFPRGTNDYMNDEVWEAMFGYKHIEENVYHNPEDKAVMAAFVQNHLESNPPQPCQCWDHYDVRYSPTCFDRRRGGHYTCKNRVNLVECPPLVKGTVGCGPRCCNRPFQNQEWKRINLFFIQHGDKGACLHTHFHIEPHMPIIEYIGEYVQESQNHMNTKEDPSEYTLFLEGSPFDLEPRYIGNLCRFAATSCDPNCVMQMYLYNGEIRMVLYSLVHIPAGSPINWSYGQDYLSLNLKMCKCYSDGCIYAHKYLPGGPDPDTVPEPTEQEHQRTLYLAKKYRQDPFAEDAARKRVEASQAQQGKAKQILDVARKRDGKILKENQNQAQGTPIPVTSESADEPTSPPPSNVLDMDIDDDGEPGPEINIIVLPPPPQPNISVPRGFLPALHDPNCLADIPRTTQSAKPAEKSTKQTVDRNDDDDDDEDYDGTLPPLPPAGAVNKTMDKPHPDLPPSSSPPPRPPPVHVSQPSQSLAASMIPVVKKCLPPAAPNLYQGIRPTPAYIRPGTSHMLPCVPLAAPPSQIPRPQLRPTTAPASQEPRNAPSESRPKSKPAPKARKSTSKKFAPHKDQSLGRSEPQKRTRQSSESSGDGSSALPSQTIATSKLKQQTKRNRLDARNDDADDGTISSGSMPPPSCPPVNQPKRGRPRKNEDVPTAEPPRRSARTRTQTHSYVEDGEQPGPSRQITTRTLSGASQKSIGKGKKTVQAKAPKQRKPFGYYKKFLSGTDYVCPTCGSKHKKAYNLEEHMKTHEEPEYKCQVEGCDYSARVEKYLEQHMQTHLQGPRPFVCPHANCPNRRNEPQRGFTRAAILRSHLEKMHGQKKKKGKKGTKDKEEDEDTDYSEYSDIPDSPPQDDPDSDEN